MTAALIALAIGVWLGFCAAIVLAIYLSARHDRQWDAEVEQAVALTEPLSPDEFEVLLIERLRDALAEVDAADRIGEAR